VTQSGEFAAGIVFRRLDGAAERGCAARLLAGCVVPGAGVSWFGLEDLLTPGACGLVGAAALDQVDDVTTQLCGLAVAPAYRGRGLGRRLLADVADRLRAAGVEQLVAPAVHDRALAALLARAGFVAPTPGRAVLPL
jgi:ribosomal protein S18 acetylase RimI-like enzyme